MLRKVVKRALKGVMRRPATARKRPKSVAATLEGSQHATLLSTLLDNLEIRDVSVNQDEELNDYSILGQVPLASKQSLVELCKKDLRLDRAMGSMCGMGIGDGMGHMYEFLPCRDVPGPRYFDLSKMKFHKEKNTFGLKYGQWTDDASMGLCMADSLIVNRRYDGSDMRQRFWNWWHRGYNNAFRLDADRRFPHSVGLGGNISESLDEMSDLWNGEQPTPVYESGGEDAGNGSLMRFAPVALFFHSIPLIDLHHFSRQSSYTTHPGTIAAESCALLGHLIVRALQRPLGEPVDPKAFLEMATSEFIELTGLEEKCKSYDDCFSASGHYQNLLWLASGRPARETEHCWSWREPSLGLKKTLRARGEEYNGYPVSSGYFGSYAPDGLAIALWAVYNSNSFDEAVAKCINTLGDADSHGSICGQLAGALYGYTSIHPQFLEWLNKWDHHEFAVRAVLLHELGLSLASSDPSKLRSES